jgi:hypothetical protein
VFQTTLDQSKSEIHSLGLSAKKSGHKKNYEQINQAGEDTCEHNNQLSKNHLLSHVDTCRIYDLCLSLQKKRTCVAEARG